MRLSLAHTETHRRTQPGTLPHAREAPQQAMRRAHRDELAAHGAPIRHGSRGGGSGWLHHRLRLRCGGRGGRIWRHGRERATALQQKASRVSGGLLGLQWRAQRIAALRCCPPSPSGAAPAPARLHGCAHAAGSSTRAAVVPPKRQQGREYCTRTCGTRRHSAEMMTWPQSNDSSAAIATSYERSNACSQQQPRAAAGPMAAAALRAAELRRARGARKLFKLCVAAAPPPTAAPRTARRTGSARTGARLQGGGVREQ
jgi:hypothetical protein